MIHSSYCEKTIVFPFWIKANYSRLSSHSNKISSQAKFVCSLLKAWKISNKSNKRLMRYCTFIFSMSCSIASVMSYLSRIKAKNLQIATSILLKFLTLTSNVSRTILRIEVSDGSFFCIFHALPFKLNVFFYRRFPLSTIE